MKNLHKWSHSKCMLTAGFLKNWATQLSKITQQTKWS